MQGSSKDKHWAGKIGVGELKQRVHAGQENGIADPCDGFKYGLVAMLPSFDHMDTTIVLSARQVINPIFNAIITSDSY